MLWSCQSLAALGAMQGMLVLFVSRYFPLERSVWVLLALGTGPVCRAALPGAGVFESATAAGPAELEPCAVAPALLERAGVPQPRDRLDPRAAARWLGHLPRGARRRQFRAGRGVAASGGCRSAFLVPGHRRRPGGLLAGLCGVFALVSPACLDILQVRRIFHAGLRCLPRCYGRFPVQRV